PDIVEDADDVIARQAGERPRLAVEPAPLFCCVGDGGTKQLDRHVALEPRVAGPPDDADATLADLFDELVPADEDRGPRPPSSPPHSARPGIATPPRRSAGSQLYRARSPVSRARDGVCSRAEGGEVTGRHLWRGLVVVCATAAFVLLPTAGATPSPTSVTI